jgi:hypothetical protein
MNKRKKQKKKGKNENGKQKIKIIFCPKRNIFYEEFSSFVHSSHQYKSCMRRKIYLKAEDCHKYKRFCNKKKERKTNNKLMETAKTRHTNLNEALKNISYSYSL